MCHCLHLDDKSTARALTALKSAAIVAKCSSKLVLHSLATFFRSTQKSNRKFKRHHCGRAMFATPMRKHWLRRRKVYLPRGVLLAAIAFSFPEECALAPSLTERYRLRFLNFQIDNNASNQSCAAPLSHYVTANSSPVLP